MAETIFMPKLGFDMQEGTLVRWVINEGENVQKGDVLAEIETDKATVEVESSFSGVMAVQLVERGISIPIGTPIAIIASPGEKIDDLRNSLSTQKAADPRQKTEKSEEVLEVPNDETLIRSDNDREKVKASPIARRIGKENSLDLMGIKGTGPGGRIVRRDVEKALEQGTYHGSSSGQGDVDGKQIQTGFIIDLNSTLKPGEDKVIDVSRLRLAIGKRMLESKVQVPHFYITHEFAVDALVAFRKDINEVLPEGNKISINDFLIKAAALSLRDFPNLNATITDKKIRQHGSINMGVAVSVDGGLLTVVIRNADVKKLQQISIEAKELAERARIGKVRPDDIEGSTFSISNLGMYDVEHFVAIINPPEAAILAIGSIKPVAAVEGGKVIPQQHMKATLSADHRITDGAEAAKFLQRVDEYLSKPLRLLA